MLFHVISCWPEYWSVRRENIMTLAYLEMIYAKAIFLLQDLDAVTKNFKNYL